VRLSWWSRPRVFWIELVTCARFCFDASSGRSPPAPDAWTPFPAAAVAAAVVDGLGAALSIGVGRYNAEGRIGRTAGDEGRRLGGATWARSRACPDIFSGRAKPPNASTKTGRDMGSAAYQSNRVAAFRVLGRHILSFLLPGASCW
jgi:hypothetical protein